MNHYSLTISIAVVLLYLGHTKPAAPRCHLLSVLRKEKNVMSQKHTYYSNTVQNVWPAACPCTSSIPRGTPRPPPASSPGCPLSTPGKKACRNEMSSLQVDHKLQFFTFLAMESEPPPRAGGFLPPLPMPRTQGGGVGRAWPPKPGRSVCVICQSLQNRTRSSQPLNLFVCTKKTCVNY